MGRGWTELSLTELLARLSLCVGGVMSLEGSKSFRVCFLCAWARVGAMQVTPSPPATTAPGNGETPGGAEPSPLLACEGPGDCCTHVSHETGALSVRELCGEPGPTNDNDPPEKSKCPRRHGTKNTLCVTIPVEAASPLEANKEEEQTRMSEEEGKLWSEVLGQY